MTDLPQTSLVGKIALVTGAGRGIGRACVQALSGAGAYVIAIARTKSDLTKLWVDCGKNVEPWVGDVRDDAIIAAIRNLPRLDVLVNNAGSNRLQSLLEVDDETLDFLITLNVRSAFKVSQAAAAVMVAADCGGSIIHISSQMGHVGGPKRAVYTMTKHAIEGLTKAMAVELGEHKIRVNAVAPTVVETSMTEPFFRDPSYREFALSMVPIKEIMQPEDVAAAVLYLASPGSRLVTGTSLRIDSGATAQ